MKSVRGASRRAPCSSFTTYPTARDTSIPTDGVYIPPEPSGVDDGVYIPS